METIMPKTSSPPSFVLDKTIVLGEFEVTSTALRISDPCYTTDSWCAGELPDVLSGTWVGVTRYAKSWGVRTYYVGAFHSDVPEAERVIPGTPEELEAGGWRPCSINVGVDSGQAGIFDAAHYREDAVVTTDPDFGHDDTPGDRWYGMCCDTTLSHVGAGVIPHGVVSRSGDGDGGYTAYVRYTGAAVTAVVIDFLGVLGGGDVEEDEDEDDD